MSRPNEFRFEFLYVARGIRLCYTRCERIFSREQELFQSSPSYSQSRAGWLMQCGLNLPRNCPALPAYSEQRVMMRFSVAELMGLWISWLLGKT